MNGHLFLSLIISFFATSDLFAHANHNHDLISEEKALIAAQIAVDSLIENKKIDKSWRAIKPNKPYKKEFKKGPEWVVTFDNPKIPQKEKQKLYVFISLTGKLIAANFSGQ